MSHLRHNKHIAPSIRTLCNFCIFLFFLFWVEGLSLNHSFYEWVWSSLCEFSCSLLMILYLILLRIKLKASDCHSQRYSKRRLFVLCFEQPGEFLRAFTVLVMENSLVHLQILWWHALRRTRERNFIWSLLSFIHSKGSTMISILPLCLHRTIRFKVNLLSGQSNSRSSGQHSRSQITLFLCCVVINEKSWVEGLRSSWLKEFANIVCANHQCVHRAE